MSVAVRPSGAADLPALLVSLGLHLALVLLTFGLSLHVAKTRPLELPNGIAMVGSSIEVEAPTPEPAAAPNDPAPPTDAAAPSEAPLAAVDVKALPLETSAVEHAAATLPSPPASRKERPTHKSNSLHAAEPIAGSAGSTAPTVGAPAAGTFGQEGLAPGVRRLGYAFTRAIPAATPADSEWRELPLGHVGTIRIELEVDSDNHLGELKHWQARPGEPAPPAVLERMVTRTLALLRAGQFALSGSNQAGSERLAIDVVIREDAADQDGADVVVQKHFEGATPARAGKAYFRYGTGRAVEATVTIVHSGK